MCRQGAKEPDMRRNRLPSTFAVLLSMFVIAGAAAQAPRVTVVGQPPQQQAQAGQQGQQFQQPAGQPLLVVPSTAAQAPAGPRIAFDLPTVELAPLLQRVERASNKRFLVDGRIGSQIYLAGVDANDVTYPVLLSILRANGLAAFESEGRVNIVPDAEMRFYAPVVQEGDASTPADLFVTRIVTVTNVEAGPLIPILRPMLPVTAHMAAMPPNKMILVDRYANIQRITEVIRALDVPPRN
jgi:general secretion pathway protein D